MFRFENRRIAGTGIGLALGSLLVAGALTGCGSGQVSQVATQDPAVNGTLGSVGYIALRNVHLQAGETGDALEPGSDVALIFTAVNDSSETVDRLIGISSDIGEVTVSGNTALAPGHALPVGTPDVAGELATEESANTADATVTLRKPIRNGLTYDFTFNFEKAGKTTLAVPISAGETLRDNAH